MMGQSANIHRLWCVCAFDGHILSCIYNLSFLNTQKYDVTIIKSINVKVNTNTHINNIVTDDPLYSI